MEISQTLFFAAEIIGVTAFAVSGAMLAIDRRLDLFGVIFLGIFTALGGGTIRDIILGIFPPKMFFSYEYVLTAVVTSVAVFILMSFLKKKISEKRLLIDRIVNVFDAIGLGVFSVTGAQMAIESGYMDNAFLVIFLGMTTGVGGGILRDVLSHATPLVLRKHIYALASIAGTGVFYLMRAEHIGYTISSLTGMALVIVIRLLAARFRWSLPKIRYENETE